MSMSMTRNLISRLWFYRSPDSVSGAAGCSRRARKSRRPHSSSPISPARLIEPRADALVRRWRRLAAAEPLAFEAEEVYDEVPEQSPAAAQRRGVVMRRPDPLPVTHGDAIQRSFYYDGRTFSASPRTNRRLASGTVPPQSTRHRLVFDQTGTVLRSPTSSMRRLLAPHESVQARRLPRQFMTWAGALPPPLFRAGDHRLQLWIDAGPSRCSKLVIAYKTEDEVRSSR